MQNWSISNPQQRQIGFLLFDPFSNHCLANALEPFRAANTILGREAYAWHILTPQDVAVQSSSGLAVMPTAGWADGLRGQDLFVVSSYGYARLATPACDRMLRAAAGRYDNLVGMDTGSWLLASAGVLDGYEATIHYEILDTFAERFPNIQACRQRWVRDRNRASCGGAMAAFEFVLDMIGQAHGTALTLEIAEMFMSAPQGQAAVFPADRRVAASVQRMQAAVENPLTIAALAAQAGCRQRVLEERFMRALGAAPRTVYRRIRLTAARRMLETGGMPVAEVALRTGYANASAFARAYRAEFGETPKKTQILGPRLDGGENHRKFRPEQNALFTDGP